MWQRDYSTLLKKYLEKSFWLKFKLDKLVINFNFGWFGKKHFHILCSFWYSWYSWSICGEGKGPLVCALADKTHTAILQRWANYSIALCITQSELVAKSRLPAEPNDPCHITLTASWEEVFGIRKLKLFCLTHIFGILCQPTFSVYFAQSKVPNTFKKFKFHIYIHLYVFVYNYKHIFIYI